MSTLPIPGDLLAHGAGMVLLDEVLALGTEHAECALTITPQSRFFEPGCGVPGWVGVEYMAQTIGVHAGHLRRLSGQAVQVGLLLGTRAYDCERAWFRDGQRLHLRAELLVRDGEGVGVYDCALSEDGAVCARAQIKAFQPDTIGEFLERLYGDAA